MMLKGSMVDCHYTKSHRDYAQLQDLTDTLLAPIVHGVVCVFLCESSK